MKENLCIIHMQTDASGHTRFKKKQLTLMKKEGLGSVGFFSALFVRDPKDGGATCSPLEIQFALTPTPDVDAKASPALSHVAPRKQLVVTLDGCLEFSSCGVNDDDPEHKVIIRAGDILLAEDLDGAGHQWRFLPDEKGVLHPWVRCYIHLGDEYDHFISRLS